MTIDRAPLLVLLTGYPDHVVNVFALLASVAANEPELTATEVCRQLDVLSSSMAVELTNQILNAGVAAGLLTCNAWAQFRIIYAHANRFLIARHPGGVLGWIRARLDAAESAADDAMPAEIDLDGHVDALGHRYLGKATRQPDGTYHVIAIIGEALARVAVRVRAQKDPA